MSRTRRYTDVYELPSLIGRLGEDERARFLYTQHLGRVFTTVAIFEHTLVWALLSANKIRLGADSEAATPARRHLAKHDLLKSYTLGNLIRVLSRHGAAEADIAYLKFVQRNRDYFIHRLFGETPWPGEVDTNLVHVLVRRMMYLEIIFGRAADRIWEIIARNGYATLVDLGEEGQLLVNDWEQELAADGGD